MTKGGSVSGRNNQKSLIRVSGLDKYIEGEFLRSAVLLCTAVQTTVKQCFKFKSFLMDLKKVISASTSMQRIHRQKREI